MMRLKCLKFVCGEKTKEILSLRKRNGVMFKMIDYCLYNTKQIKLTFVDSFKAYILIHAKINS